MWKTLGKKLYESLISVLPIAALVIILAFVVKADIGTEVLKIDFGTIGLFAVGAVLLILGMGLFTLGADVAMMPMGSSVGSFISKTKKKNIPWVLIIVMLIGLFITIAEPDLQVLGAQLGENGATNWTLIIAVAIGVGIFLVISALRTFLKIKLKYLLLGFYGVVFALAIAVQIVNPDFLAVAFDSGGVTTGPITVPFLMAFGLGLATVRSSKSNSEDSFGIIALCSIGPIIAVMILGLSGSSHIDSSLTDAPVINNFLDVLKAFGNGFLTYAAEVGLALIPIIIIFFMFQIFALKLPKSQVIRIVIGILYTYVGLTIFLTGVNVGFLPMGQELGGLLASTDFNWILIPLGVVMGCFIVLAEPAVHVLTKQVEEVTGGSISKKSMLIFLCAGIAIAVGLAMVRVLTGVSIWFFIVPVYAIALVLMFIVPPVFTGIAFDSGGVASGPMTATFLLPFAMGACAALGGNILTDAFGLVAFVAMIPLLTVQVMGLLYKVKSARGEAKLRRIAASEDGEIINLDDTIDFDNDEVTEDVSAEVVAVAAPKKRASKRKDKSGSKAEKPKSKKGSGSGRKTAQKPVNSGEDNQSPDDGVGLHEADTPRDSDDEMADTDAQRREESEKTEMTEPAGQAEDAADMEHIQDDTQINGSSGPAAE